MFCDINWSFTRRDSDVIVASASLKRRQAGTLAPPAALLYESPTTLLS